MSTTISFSFFLVNTTVFLFFLLTWKDTAETKSKQLGSASYRRLEFFLLPVVNAYYFKDLHKYPTIVPAVYVPQLNDSFFPVCLRGVSGNSMFYVFKDARLFLEKDFLTFQATPTSTRFPCLPPWFSFPPFRTKPPLTCFGWLMPPHTVSPSVCLFPCDGAICLGVRVGDHTRPRPQGNSHFPRPFLLPITPFLAVPFL